MDIDVASRLTCREFNERFFNEIVRQNRYDLVVFSSAIAPHLMRQSFGASAEILDAIDQDYVLLGYPLYFKDSTRNLIAKHGDLDGLDEYVRSQMRVGCAGENGFDTLVPAAHFISVKSLVCDGIDPIYRVGNMLIHRDEFHLSQFGSKFLSDRLAPLLIEKMNGSGS